MRFFEHEFKLEIIDKFDTPQNSKLAKIFSLKFMFKKPYLS